MVIPNINFLSFFSSIRKFVKPCLPRNLGSSQNITALRDVMAVTVRFVGLSGNATSHKMCKLKLMIQENIKLHNNNRNEPEDTCKKRYSILWYGH